MHDIRGDGCVNDAVPSKVVVNEPLSSDGSKGEEMRVVASGDEFEPGNPRLSCKPVHSKHSFGTAIQQYRSLVPTRRRRNFRLFLVLLSAFSYSVTTTGFIVVPKQADQRPPSKMDALSKQFQKQYDRENHKRPSSSSSASSPERPPIPAMPSNLFREMAQSQLELLAYSLSQGDYPSTSKVQSMILYLPAENAVTGQLEFTPAVLYPDPKTERVFIASDAASGQAPTLPRTLTKLPGFSHASTLLPGYPMLSHNNNHMPEVGMVEEVLCDIRFRTSALSVPLLRGSQTVGVLLVSPAVKSVDGWHIDRNSTHPPTTPSSTPFQWTDQDKEQVSRAAQSLSMALMMDQERSVLREQNNAFRESLSDSLHQVKNPIQALRTYGKILQTQIAETKNDLGSGTPQLLELTERLMAQSERVVDLLQPMDRLVDSMDESMVLLPPAQNDTSQSMVLWGGRVKEPANGARVASNDTTYTSNYSTVGHSTLVGDFEMEMMFVTDVLDTVFGTFQAIAEEHGVAFQIIVENEDEIPGVWGSPLCLQEAVTNVLDNAFKYATIGKLDSPFSINPSPQVVVRIFPNINDQAGVSIEVRDNGPGIEKEEEERIFQRGYRGQATSSMVDGKGIGLDISRALMVRMGGKLQVATAHKQLEGTAMQLTLYRV